MEGLSHVVTVPQLKAAHHTPKKLTFIAVISFIGQLADMIAYLASEVGQESLTVYALFYNSLLHNI
jgi:hypothetical protein